MLIKEDSTPQLKEGQTINQQITHMAIVTTSHGEASELQYEDFGELVEELGEQFVSVFSTYDSFFGETLYNGQLISVQSQGRLNVSGNYFINAQPYTLAQAEAQLEESRGTLREHYMPVNLHTSVVESMERAIAEFKQPDETEAVFLELVETKDGELGVDASTKKTILPKNKPMVKAKG